MKIARNLARIDSRCERGTEHDDDNVCCQGSKHGERSRVLESLNTTIG